jgi:hypothetical protein
MGELKPEDEASGLVERSWVRTSRKGGILTERTLEGDWVAVRFFDRDGSICQAEGTVCRDEAGTLVVESWADGVRRQTAVPRDASVDKSRDR